MRVRTWIGSLSLVVSALSFPAYTQSNHERLIVRFKEGITSFAADAIHQGIGIRSKKKLNQLNSIEVLELPKNISVKEAVKLYEKNSRVLYAEPDFQIRINPIRGSKSKKKRDLSSMQWALNNVGQKVGKYVGKADADINGPEAWELSKGDKEVVLGIIDTGIYYTHPDLKENIWENPGEIAGNKIDDDEDGYVDDIHGINAMEKTGDPLDDNGHGTHCSGVMGGTGSSAEGALGVNQKISIIGCKFLDSDGGGRMSDALVCMDYFAKLKSREKNPVNLVAINASWGGGRYSKAMFDAIKHLQEIGILFAAAAGNDSEDNDEVDSFPANYKLENIISVAATNNKDELAFFSNYGLRSVHVAAPGMDIFSTVLNDGYDTLSGTSMAAPYVTGLIGLIKAHDPKLDWKQLKNLVIAGGNSLEALSEKTVSGRRIRAADKDGHGSLTCLNQRSHGRMLPVENKLNVYLGDSVEFSFLNIRCGEADTAPSMAVNMGRPAQFVDQAGTGIYSATWKADALGSYEFDLSDGEKVIIEVRQPAAN